MAVLLALGMLLVAAACGGKKPNAEKPEPERAATGEATTREPKPERPSAMPRLRALVDQLDRAAGSAEDTEKLGDVPSWLTGHGGAASPEVDPDELQRIASSEQPARVRALALLWLAEHRRVEDLAAMEAALEVEEPAGSFPEVQLPQQAAPAYPVQWAERTLGEVARGALERMAGRPFADAAAYGAWKADIGDPAQSPVFWVGALRSLHEGDRRERRLQAIKRRDLQLYVRVVLAAGDPSWAVGQDADDFAQVAVTAFGPARMLQLVQRDDVWPELRQPEEFAKFARWFYDNAQVLLGDKHAESLLILWQFERHPAVEFLRQDLALAAVRSNPAYRRSIYTGVLDEAPTPRMARVLRQLTLHHAAEERERLQSWFMKHRKSDAIVENRLAIIEAAGERGDPGRKLLARLVGSRKFRTDNGQVIAALGRAVQTFGGSLDESCQSSSALQVPMTKGGKITRAERKAAAKARKRCLQAAKKWLKKNR